MNKPLQSRNRTLRGPLFHFQLSQLKFITKLIRVNFNWWHGNVIIPAPANLLILLVDRHRHYESIASSSSSFVVFCEAAPKGKTISSPCNRDGYIAEISFCTLQKGLYLALEALHTHHWAGCLWTCAVRETSFTHQEIMSTLAPISLVPTAGDKWTMHQGSAERSRAILYHWSKGFALFSNWDAKRA